MEEQEKGLFEQGMGNVTWWGFSPASQVEIPNGENDSKVLLLGSGDGRHIIHSITKEDRKHFYVFEQNLMLYARQMLLMALLQEKTSSEEESEKKAAELLEILGCVSFRKETSETVAKMAKKIADKVVESMSNGGNDGDFLRNVDLSKLKSKELDVLEEILKFWKGEDDGETIVDLEKFWDFRIRQLLMDRYDARDGCFDMDYNLRLVDRGGAKISNKEYLHWRRTGNAFPEDYDEPKISNLTLVSSVMSEQKSTGKKELTRGYWGDIVTGPFLSFGFVQSKEVDVDKIKMETLARNRAVVYFKEIFETLRKTDDISWPLVTFLSVSSGEKDLLTRHKYHSTFDVVFIGCGVTHFLEESFVKNLKGDQESVIYVETPLFLLHIANEVQEKFKDHLNEICSKVKVKVVVDYDPLSTAVVKITRDFAE